MNAQHEFDRGEKRDLLRRQPEYITAGAIGPTCFQGSTNVDYIDNQVAFPWCLYEMYIAGQANSTVRMRELLRPQGGSWITFSKNHSEVVSFSRQYTLHGITSSHPIHGRIPTWLSPRTIDVNAYAMMNGMPLKELFFRSPASLEYQHVSKLAHLHTVRRSCWKTQCCHAERHLKRL